MTLPIELVRAGRQWNRLIQHENRSSDQLGSFSASLRWNARRMSLLNTLQDHGNVQRLAVWSYADDPAATGWFGQAPVTLGQLRTHGIVRVSTPTRLSMVRRAFRARSGWLASLLWILGGLVDARIRSRRVRLHGRAA